MLYALRNGTLTGTRGTAAEGRLGMMKRDHVAWFGFALRSHADQAALGEKREDEDVDGGIAVKDRGHADLRCRYG